MTFKDRLRQLRLEKEWSQSELGYKLNMGQAMVGKYEQGQKFPSAERLIEIARVFNVSIDYLVGISNVPGVLDEDEVVRDPELTRIVELARPTIDGVPLTDDQWRLLNAFLNEFIAIEREKKKKKIEKREAN